MPVFLKKGYDITIMERKFTRQIQKHCLWLSLLIHAALLATYIVVLPVSMYPLKKQEPLPSYVPSYVDNSQAQEVDRQQQQQNSISDEKLQKEKQLADKENEKQKYGIEKPKATRRQQADKQAAQPAQPAESRKAEFSRNLVPEDISDPDNREQMHLIGDTKIIKPIIKILAKALQEHLRYPKIAQDFNLRGTVLVGFMLDPQGYVSGTRIVKSSGAGVLDDAARSAVNGMSPVQGVGNYMSKAEFMVVGIIFG